MFAGLELAARKSLESTSVVYNTIVVVKAALRITPQKSYGNVLASKCRNWVTLTLCFSEFIAEKPLQAAHG